MKDCTGRVFGRLTVIGREAQKGRKQFFLCRCECGNEKLLFGGNLISGNTQSCGCLHREWAKKPRKHGACTRTNGVQTFSREYRAWNAAKNRCNHPQRTRYHGRGITMCDRWKKDYLAFLSDMGPAPDGYELDRIDNDGPYSPENCRWATRSEQMNNTNATRHIDHEGKRMSIANWSRETGIAYSCLIGRINSGWSIPEALAKQRRRNPLKRH